MKYLFILLVLSGCAKTVSQPIKYEVQSAIISCVNQQDCFDAARTMCHGDYIAAAPQYTISKDGSKYYLNLICKR
jgi:hypothetical protein